MPACARSWRKIQATNPDADPMSQLQPFHLAIPVGDLAAARVFYGDVIGCSEGRSSAHWIDFDFFGHQLVVHEVAGYANTSVGNNAVDGHDVPVPHFGVIVEWHDWQQFADRLRARNTTFVIEPGIRFKGQTGEQATMFLLDPSGNALEFKAFRDIGQLFAK